MICPQDHAHAETWMCRVTHKCSCLPCKKKAADELGHRVRSLDEIARVMYDASVAKARAEGAHVEPWEKAPSSAVHTLTEFARALVEAFPELGAPHPEGQNTALFDIEAGS